MSHTGRQLVFGQAKCHKDFWLGLYVPKNRVSLGVKTCDFFLCFVATVRVTVYYVVFSLVYVTGECHRFLHRG